MITLGTNDTNSIYADQTGSLVVLSGAVALAQTLGQISRTRRGEMVFATDKGIPYWDTVFQTKDILMFEAAMRAEFMKHPEVNRINSFVVTISGEELAYVSEIDTIYGVVKVNG